MVVREPYRKVAIAHKSDERMLLDYYLKRDNQEALYKAQNIQAQMLAMQIQAGV